MSKLSLRPIVDVVPDDVKRDVDDRTKAVWDRSLGLASWEVSAPSGTLGARIIAVGGIGWDRIDVSLTQHAEATVAARVNRLMAGTDFPRIEKYFRTGEMVVRTQGSPTPVPCTLTVARPTLTSAWRITKVQRITAAQAATPTPPPAPVQTPVQHNPLGEVIFPPQGTVVSFPKGTLFGASMTPQPVAPAPTLSPAPVAPVAPVLAPEPEPEPEPEPVVIEPPAPITPPSPVVSSQGMCSCPPGDCLFTYPDPSLAGRIVTSDLTHKAMRAAVAKHQSGTRSTVALVGPKGCGKTEAVWDLAAELGIGLFVFDGASATSFSDWTGTTGLVPDSGAVITHWVPTSFIEAIRQDGPHGDEFRIVLIDEVNRAELAGALNALMPILSAASVYVAETGRTIRVSRNVMFMFTLNRGSAYNATVTLDAALTDRIQAWLRFDYLPEGDEAALVTSRMGEGVFNVRKGRAQSAPQRTPVTSAQAEALVGVARQIRSTAERGEVSDGISTRRVLDAASFVAWGLTPREAAEVCWANLYPDEGGSEGERGIVLTSINSALV